jgi:hypothetical protein
MCSCFSFYSSLYNGPNRLYNQRKKAGKYCACCFEIRKYGQWVRLSFPYGLEYPTTESLGLCHCKTSVLDKLCPPLGWRIVSMVGDTMIPNNGSFKEPDACPVSWEGTYIERHS